MKATGVCDCADTVWEPPGQQEKPRMFVGPPVYACLRDAGMSSKEFLELYHK